MPFSPHPSLLSLKAGQWHKLRASEPVRGTYISVTQVKSTDRVPANSAIQSRSKRSRHQDAEAEDGHGHGSMAHKTQRHAVVHGEESEDNQEDDGENLSTQSITCVSFALSSPLGNHRVLLLKSVTSSSELETDITTFIRNTGKNDAWPTSFKNHVRDRESGLLERLGTGSAEM